MDEGLDEIARRMQVGDQAAFVEFSDLVGPRLYRRLAARGVPPADSEAIAVSILSEVAVKIHRFEYRGAGSFWGWVRQVGDNFYRDQLRQRRPASLESLALVAEPMVSEQQDDEAEAEAELVREVWAAIDRLDEPDRTIVARRLEEPDRTYGDIGGEVGLNAGAVRVRHHRALGKLAADLARVTAVAAWRRRSRSLAGIFTV